MIEVGIIDYGVGNLRSVVNAFAAVGTQAVVLEGVSAAERCRRLVIPGVGAFAAGMHRLRESGWEDWLQLHGRPSGRPLLGLCLGMQLLAERGLEHGVHAGLGWVAGQVEAIDDHNGTLRVPHMGWNEVQWQTPRHAFTEGIAEGACFYFVHSYHLVLRDPRVLIGTCDYGAQLTAVIADPPLFGTQFHPEKSQKAGLTLLKTFASWPC